VHSVEAPTPDTTQVIYILYTTISMGHPYTNHVASHLNPHKPLSIYIIYILLINKFNLQFVVQRSQAAAS